jgi:PAS domain S-box-containing protein
LNFDPIPEPNFGYRFKLDEATRKAIVTPNSACVLIVEDQSIIALDLRNALTRLGYSVPAIASAGRDAIEKAARIRPDLVLMDIHLRGEIDGIQAAEEICSRFDVPVVYLTAYADPRTLQRVRITEPYGYLLKPFQEKELQLTIEIALCRHRMERKLRDSERWLTATLRSIGDAVVATDADWRVRFINPAAESLTGWQAAEAVGRDLAEVLPVSISASQPLRAERGALQGGIAQGVLVCRDGREVPIQESSTTIRDDHGRVIGSVIAIREIAGDRLPES